MHQIYTRESKLVNAKVKVKKKLHGNEIFVNLISFENITKSFSEKEICKNQSFGIHENDKIGLNNTAKIRLYKKAGYITAEISKRNGANNGEVP